MTYGSVKSNILSRNPLPMLDEAYQILVQDEDSRGVARALEERHETMAFATQLPYVLNLFSAVKKERRCCVPVVVAKDISRRIVFVLWVTHLGGVIDHEVNLLCLMEEVLVLQPKDVVLAGEQRWLALTWQQRKFLQEPLPTSLSLRSCWTYGAE